MSASLDLFKRLFEPFPEDQKRTKQVSGRAITFVGWTDYIVRAWKQFHEGFSTEVRSITEIGRVFVDPGTDEAVDDRQVVVVVRVIDKATGLYHEATGTAPISKTKANWGGAVAEAESQALRRAFAHFGLGLEMYFSEDEFEAIVDDLYGEEEEEDEEEAAEPSTPMTEAQAERLAEYGAAIEEWANEPDADFERVTTVATILEGAREKLREADDQKAVAGVIIRGLKQWMEEQEIEIPEPEEEESEEDPS